MGWAGLVLGGKGEGVLGWLWEFLSHFRDFFFFFLFQGLITQ